jgi:hypothetical protein
LNTDNAKNGENEEANGKDIAKHGQSIKKQHD